MEVTNEERHGPALNSNYSQRECMSERHLLCLLSVLSILDVGTHIKVRVAGGRQVIENDVKSVHYIRMKR